MREDRFHYRNKMNAEYSAWPGPGAYQPLVSGIGKQVKSQHTTRPNCRFGAEGRFGGKDPRTTHGQGPDPIDNAQHDLKDKLKKSKSLAPPNTVQRLNAQPGPGSYHAKDTLVKEAPPMPVFSRDVRLEDRSAGPHNRTLHALTKQPGPGAYMLPGAFGDQVDKTSNPGYRFGRGFLHDIDEHACGDLGEPPYPVRPQSAPVKHVVVGRQQQPRQLNADPARARPQTATHIRSAAGASRPLSGESQASFTRPKAQELRPTSGSSNQRPATARAPRVNAPGEFAQRRRPMSAVHPTYGYGPTKIPLHVPIPPKGNAADSLSDEFFDLPEYSGPLEPDELLRNYQVWGPRGVGSGYPQRPASATVRSGSGFPRDDSGKLLQGRPQSSGTPKANTQQVASNFSTKKTGVNPIAFKKLLGTRYWETSPIRQHPNPPASNSTDLSNMFL